MTASADPVHLEYVVADELACPSEREFRAELVSKLGDDPFRDAAPTTVIVHIEATDQGPAGNITWSSERGALPGFRRFEPRAQTCRALAANMAFAVTVQIELLRIRMAHESGGDGLESEVQVTPPRDSTTSEAPSTADAFPEASVPPPATPPNGAARSWNAGAGALMLVGWAPEVTLGARVFAARREHWFGLELGAEASASTRLERSDGSGFEVMAWSGALAPCVNLSPFSGCAVIRLGQVRANGFGVDRPRSTDALLSQVGLRFVLSQPIGDHFAASAHVEALGNLTPWRVELDRSEVWAAPPVVGVLGVAVSVTF